MRTTVRLDDDLMRRVKAEASLAGVTLTRFIEDALRRALETPGTDGPAPDPYRVPTFRSRLRDGVQFDDNAALLELMESR